MMYLSGNTSYPFLSKDSELIVYQFGANVIFLIKKNLFILWLMKTWNFIRGSKSSEECL